MEINFQKLSYSGFVLLDCPHNQMKVESRNFLFLRFFFCLSIRLGFYDFLSFFKVPQEFEHSSCLTRAATEPSYSRDARRSAC